MWGCTIFSSFFFLICLMVPTHVGVYRIDTGREFYLLHGPHACGGVPQLNIFNAMIREWSPRMWGCTELIANICNGLLMVPTHVGVYRLYQNLYQREKHGPHACGGVPQQHLKIVRILKWSPRMWGCTGRSFVF